MRALAALLLSVTVAWGDGRQVWRDRLAADPLDGGAMLAIADAHEKAGRTGHARTDR